MDSDQIALGGELLEAMIRTGYRVLANILAASYGAGWESGRVFSIRDLVELGVPEKRARKAFAQMEGKEVDQRKRGSRSFSPKLSPLFFISKEETNLGKKARHRPAVLRKLPNPEDLAKVFQVRVTRYTPMKPAQNLADWCAEVYASKVDREPGRHARKDLCQPIGISRATSRAYDRRARIKVTPTFRRVQLKNAGILPETPDLPQVWLETQELVPDKRGNTQFRRFSATKSGYARALKSALAHGGSVWMVRQLANDYRRNKHESA